MKKRITVLLAEDHAIVRKGLRSLLAQAGDFEVVGEAANGREAVTLAHKFHPDVVVMDIAMPVLNGFEATRQILHAIPSTRVLVLSAHSDDEYVTHMVSVGAAGYLLKQNSGHALAHAVREVASGRVYFCPAIARRRCAAKQRSPASSTQIPRPSKSRKAEVLQLVAEGLANRQIAVRLGINLQTVARHRQPLLGKPGLRGTAVLTRDADADGLLKNVAPAALA